MAEPCPNTHRPFWRSRNGTALLVLAAVGAFFLTTEHRAHLLGALPYLLLLACPLMHLFMHHGHHGQGATPSRDTPEEHHNDRT